MSRSRKLINIVDKVKYLDIVWEILSQSYATVSGGLLFSSKNDLLTSTSVWKVVLKKGKVIAVTIFKSKHGLKLVAMGITTAKNKKDVLKKLAQSIEEDLNHIWMEVSGSAETFIMKYCHAYRYIIHNSFASTLLGKEVLEDASGYHYIRAISGIQKQKIIVGTPNIQEIFHIT